MNRKGDRLNRNRRLYQALAALDDIDALQLHLVAARKRLSRAAAQPVLPIVQLAPLAAAALLFVLSGGMLALYKITQAPLFALTGALVLLTMIVAVTLSQFAELAFNLIYPQRGTV